MKKYHVVCHEPKNHSANNAIILASSKIRSLTQFSTCLRSDVKFIQYRYDIGFDGILKVLTDYLASKTTKHFAANGGGGAETGACVSGGTAGLLPFLTNLAIVVYSTPFAMFICSQNGRMQQFCRETLQDNLQLKHFFCQLNSLYDVSSLEECRLDFLNCKFSSPQECMDIQNQLQNLINIKCYLYNDMCGKVSSCQSLSSSPSHFPDEIYFELSAINTQTMQNSLENFELIRMVGKGAFGTAVLYRKIDEDSLVILKQINILDLTAQERQLAINEVHVLSMLDHPNIVTTLAEFIAARQSRFLEEIVILQMFRQIVAALHYIHSHKILHRDLKTSNIFLTRKCIIKIGDFGISKMLTTNRSKADTIVGTAYYISPEICEGKPYNRSSDIWSLGCILHELACLQRTFEASNLNALVNKIVQGKIAPIKGNYSDEFKRLVFGMLQKNDSERLGTDEILHHILPNLLSQCKDSSKLSSFSENLNSNFSISQAQSPKTTESRSVLYAMNLPHLTLSPINLPQRIRIKEVACGSDHFLASSTEKIVYSWGKNRCGQLGHDDQLARGEPESIHSLKGKSICKIGCGDEFSMFKSDNGILMTCGSGEHGCLGHGDQLNLCKPKIIEIFLSVDIISFSTTYRHVLAVNSDGMLYSWGCNSTGQTGHGINALQTIPTPITYLESTIIKQAYTSHDASMLVTDVGTILASGNNAYNKLALNQRQGVLTSMKLACNVQPVLAVNRFSVVRALSRHQATRVALGKCHSVIIIEPGKLISFGLNSCGQLGNGSTREHPCPLEMRRIPALQINSLVCGEQFTVASVNSDELLFCGRRIKGAQFSQNTSMDNDNHNEHNNDEMASWKKDVKSFSSCPSADPLLDSKTSQEYSIDENIGKSNSIDNARANSADIYPLPVPILRLNNPSMKAHSNESSIKLEKVSLSDIIIVQGDAEQILIQIETTAPAENPAKKNSFSRRKSKSLIRNKEQTTPTRSIFKKESSNSSSSMLNKNRSDDNEMPTWLRNEFENSPAINPESSASSNDFLITRKSEMHSNVESASMPRLVRQENNVSSRRKKRRNRYNLSTSNLNQDLPQEIITKDIFHCNEITDEDQEYHHSPRNNEILVTHNVENDYDESSSNEKILNLKKRLSFQLKIIQKNENIMENLQEEIRQIKSKDKTAPKRVTVPKSRNSVASPSSRVCLLQ